MSKKTNQSGIIAQSQQQKPTKRSNNLRDMVLKMANEGQFAMALPKVVTPERFTRIALSALSSNPALMDCTPKSFLGALMQAAQLGLEPNTPLGQAYLIPYQNRRAGTTECQFQLGYKGMIDLAYRSGEMSAIYAHSVHEGDEFSYEYGLDQKLVHKPGPGDRGDATHYYAVWKLQNGGYGFLVWSVADVEKHARRFSKAYSSGPWKDHFDEMAKKTVLKAALKYAPIRTDFVVAGLQADEATVHADMETFDLTTSYEIVGEEKEENVIDPKTGEILSGPDAIKDDPKPEAKPKAKGTPKEAAPVEEEIPFG